ncbi:hypothetical protein CBER1_06369 [Cercospora berteroae]|uniref:Uncharacterized protein n=1 Tax=Cercospora berteroae TaxID=357750 RepID=A0A2S6C939_9PEZI|nr:hypothetical protein CBER1_06369 [Cercospora berteroae]
MVRLASSFILLFGALQWVSGSAIADPHYNKQNVCRSDQYAKYQELSSYGPAKAYCKSKFPSTVTVTAKPRYYKRTAEPEPYRQTPANYVSPKPTKCYGSKKDCLLSSVKAGPKSAAKTVCSCFVPQKTVTRTIYPTTKTTTKCTTKATVGTVPKHEYHYNVPIFEHDHHHIDYFDDDFD